MMATKNEQRIAALEAAAGLHKPTRVVGVWGDDPEPATAVGERVRIVRVRWLDPDDARASYA